MLFLENKLDYITQKKTMKSLLVFTLRQFYCGCKLI